jgi:hypothetical protein
MKYTLYDTMVTKDGHRVEIHRKRNALLMCRYQYYVSIFSKARYNTNRTAVIYGWSGVDIEVVKKEIRAWTTDILFERNKYLLELAENFKKRLPP